MYNTFRNVKLNPAIIISTMILFCLVSVAYGERHILFVTAYMLLPYILYCDWPIIVHVLLFYVFLCATS